MRLSNKVFISTFLLSSLVFADTGVSMGESSAALSELKAASLEGKSEKLIYLVEDFSQLKTVPGFSFGAPSGLTPGWGVGFAALSGNHSSENTDGAMAFGLGYGDPFKSIGGAASLSIGSINPTDGGSFNRGSLNLSAGHSFKDYGLGVSAGIVNIDLWHATHDDKVDESYYAAVTKLLPNNVAPVIFTAGLGNEAYVDIDTEDDRNKKLGLFFSGAVYVHPQMSLILDYTTGITTLGTSIVPFPDYPVSIGLGINDIFKENDNIKFIGTLAAGFVF